jgi:hypothetical protein
MVPVAQEDGSARHFRYSQQFYGCVQHAGWQSNPRHSSSTLQTGYIFYRISMPKMRHCQRLKWLQECLGGDYVKFSLVSTVIVRTPAIYGICVCESVTFSFQDLQTHRHADRCCHTAVLAASKISSPQLLDTAQD